MADSKFERPVEANVIWFRHGLRLHDNPALLEAISDQNDGVALIPIFTFDGESAGDANVGGGGGGGKSELIFPQYSRLLHAPGTKCVGYNRMRFLLESLKDIDQQLQQVSRAGGRLHIFRGHPSAIFRRISSHVRIRKICFEQDCEPIWHERDDSVKSLCHELGIQAVEKVSHTLWDPRKVVSTNGGIPPLTYQMFLHTVQIIGLPPRPVDDPNWKDVKIFNFPSDLLNELNAFRQFPTPQDLNVLQEHDTLTARSVWRGGETPALLLLNQRLQVEGNAFKQACYLSNQVNPNILESPKSMSAHLRFGCLSVRRFYWDVHDLFTNVQSSEASGYGFQMTDGAHITSQLIWREYFYTMSVNNPNYDRMEGNEICLNIPWAPPVPDHLHRWKMGQTGFPLIDAAMRQLLCEGWLHHTLRNAVATFLTRGGLWQSWEHGLQHFLKYLLDADWSVCAGNWMWVSSSAFEQLLDSSLVTCPLALARRLDPNGEYVRQYVTELKNVPNQYIHEPWRMPADLQESVDCILGVHYPERMIDLGVASKRNMLAMRALRKSLIECGARDAGNPHCRPSSDEEIRQFFWLAN